MFGDTNYEAFLYLYFLKKTASLFFKMSPFGIFVLITREYKISFLSSSDEVNEYIIIVFTLLNLMLLYNYLKDFFRKVHLYNSRRENLTNALMFSKLRTDINTTETKDFISRVLKASGLLDEHFKVYVIPDTVKLIKSIYDKIDEDSYYLSETLDLRRRFSGSLLSSSSIFNSDFGQLKRKSIQYIRSSCSNRSNILTLHHDMDNLIENTKSENVKIAYTNLKINKKLLEFYLKGLDNFSEGVAFVVFTSIANKSKIFEQQSEIRKMSVSYFKKMGIEVSFYHLYLKIRA